MKNIKLVLPLFFVISSFTEVKAQLIPYNSIIVAGHAYGAHEGSNIGLHPPFLKTLKDNLDPNTTAVFLTGDIVNHSTAESWEQVEFEIKELDLNAYFVMGNHDNNEVGIDYFQKRHGGTYYSFLQGTDLFIVLNSTESDRSISAKQLQFLNDVLEKDNSGWKNVFIFFHEVIWNSNEKYRDLRSNNRSRYDEIVNVSNFWTDVFPMLSNYSEKKIFLFAGDVGGNPDAIAATYDRWGNVTLISSGMGEVIDENYLKVDICSDTVLFSLIPLNEEIEMRPIEWYNIPEKPDKIYGPLVVDIQLPGFTYQASPVFNATEFQWMLSDGIIGNSSSATIDVHFETDFQKGTIGVKAINDGFGNSELTILELFSDKLTELGKLKPASKFELEQNDQFVRIKYRSVIPNQSELTFYNQTGKKVFNSNFCINSGINGADIHKNELGTGLFIVKFSDGREVFTEKIILY